MATRKNGSITEGREADSRLNEGNPGKPKGARHKVTRAVVHPDQTQNEGFMAIKN